MEKKKNICLLFIIICFVCLTSCNKSCTHGYDVITYVEPTCTEEGYRIYKCRECGDTYTEKYNPIGHVWQRQSSTASCTENGTTIYNCKRCTLSKTENTSAFGHSFDKDGYCVICKDFKYSIQLVSTSHLPMNLIYGFKYTDHTNVYTRFRLEQVSFKLISSYNGTYLGVVYNGKKTYDKDGDLGTNSAGFKIKIETKSGEVIGLIGIWRSGLIVGQQYSGEVTSDININVLSTSEEYIFKIFDYLL